MRLNEIQNIKALPFLKSLPDNCCDLFTDPPYNVGKKYGDYEDNLPDDEYLTWIAEVLKECKRVSINMVVYVPKKWNLEYWNILGKEFQEIILPFNPAGAIRYGFSNQFNKLLTNAKPEKKGLRNVWTNMQQPGLGFFYRENTYDHPGRTSDHITDKAILKLLPNDVICDPFMGTGTTAVLALKNGKQFIGSEQNPKDIVTANNRIKDFQSQLRLFANKTKEFIA